MALRCGHPRAERGDGCVRRGSGVDVTPRGAHGGRACFEFWHRGMHREGRRWSTAGPERFVPSSIDLRGVRWKVASLGRRTCHARKMDRARLAEGAPRDERAGEEVWSSELTSLAGCLATLERSGYEPWHSVRSGGHGPKSNVRRSGGETRMDGRARDRSTRGILGVVPIQAWWAARLSMGNRSTRQSIPAVQTLSISSGTCRTTDPLRSRSPTEADRPCRPCRARRVPR